MARKWLIYAIHIADLDKRCIKDYNLPIGESAERKMYN